MQENQEKIKLYIPQGLNTNKELFKGIDQKSLITMAIIFIGLNIPNVLLSIFIIKKPLFTVFYLSICFMLSAMLVVKDSSGVNVLDILGFFIRFLKTQKRYEYLQKDEWR
ncbi:hypothetical protein FL857_03470 [Criibacterium bergeronii]|uniref:PrgI family protein n=1 Tax=Criibacterium bergeronii TaxID=1871336 RepID=A0A552VC57_9FIRM|nr:hypothetical protein [Criibacterium bergeronii]TRW28064.1 hypothetical protein FL857_03470 [Criibacterium bergeronii]